VNTKRARFRTLGTWLIAAPVLAILLWTVVYPNISVITGSFSDGLANWRAFAVSPADREALRATLIVAVGSVITATAIGLPLAFLLARTEFRGRRLIAAVATLPAVLPPLVGVIALLFLYGESGVVTRTVQRLLHLSTASSCSSRRASNVMTRHSTRLRLDSAPARRAGCAVSRCRCSRRPSPGRCCSSS